MTVLRNPKQEGTNFWDCVPQRGPCPMGCNQCYYNRVSECVYCHGAGVFGSAEALSKCQHCNGTGRITAYYIGWEPVVPSPEEVGEGIVRVNCGHDSNLQRDLVLKTAQQYKHVFFNTSILRFDFPGPVVYTANPVEEEPAMSPFKLANMDLKRLMFVRLRVSASNLDFIEQAIEEWTGGGVRVSVVLTFMAYYDGAVPQCPNGDRPYIWKTRHINSYWCATPKFMRKVLQQMKRINERLVTMCGTPESNYCRDCRNCESYYWQTIKRLKGC